jgi:hypothetical protein
MILNINKKQTIFSPNFSQIPFDLCLWVVLKEVRKSLDFGGLKYVSRRMKEV